MRLIPTFLVVALSAFLPLLANAQRGDLYTNSVSYCAEARAVIVEAFDIAYHRSNESITFSFSFASVSDDLNVSANIYVNAYGRQVINQTLNLCDYLQGVICPLPQVNFTGFGTYPIPTSYTKDIPALGYTVPNLEAYARVQLIQDDSGEVAACLQATLSNGHTTKHKAVAIASAIFTLVALLIGLFHSAINSPSPAQYRWFDILYLYQTAVAAGLLHLNYPLAFSNFVQNFAWSFAFFHSSSMQNSINSMRHKTGGHLDGNAYNEVQYINRRLSPYNFQGVNLNTVKTPAQLSNLIATYPTTHAADTGLVSRATIPSALYTNDTSAIMTGIPTYTNSLNIPPPNAFTTIFFFFLAFIGIAIVFHALLFVVVFAVDRAVGDRRTNWATRLRRMWWDFCAGNALRICLIWFLPVWIFGFYQFKIGDSKLAIFFAVLAILLTLVPLATAFVLSVLRARKPSSTAPGVSPLYTSYRWFHSVGVLYRAYRQRFHFFWFAPLVLAMIVRAAFIAFGPASAWAQVIGNMVIEFVVFVLLIACRPHKDRKGDWLAPFLSFARLIAFSLLIAFIPSMNIDAIIRTVIGIVEIAVFGIPTVLLFFGLIWNAGYGYLWRRHTHRIEDGLEVERFVADDDSNRAAMTQRDSLYAPPSGVMASRNDSGPSVDPSLQRRTSIMEPVDATYEPGSQEKGYGAPSDVYASAAAGGHEKEWQQHHQQQAQQYLHAPASSDGHGAGMAGVGGGFAGYGAGTGTPMEESRRNSRRSSRTSLYYTPGTENYYTPGQGESAHGHGDEGDQYFARR